MARDDDYIGLRRFSRSLLCVSAFFCGTLCYCIRGIYDFFLAGEKKVGKFQASHHKKHRTQKRQNNKHDDDDVAHRFLLVGLDQSSPTTTKAKEEQQQQ